LAAAKSAVSDMERVDSLAGEDRAL
jgi:hypothetical protein